MWHDQLGHHFHHLHFLSGSLGRQHYHCGSRTSAITTSVKLWDWVRQDFLSGEDWQQIFLLGGSRKLVGDVEMLMFLLLLIRQHSMQLYLICLLCTKYCVIALVGKATNLWGLDVLAGLWLSGAGHARHVLSATQHFGRTGLKGFVLLVKSLTLSHAAFSCNKVQVQGWLQAWELLPLLTLLFKIPFISQFDRRRLDCASGRLHFDCPHCYSHPFKVGPPIAATWCLPPACHNEWAGWPIQVRVVPDWLRVRLLWDSGWRKWWTWCKAFHIPSCKWTIPSQFCSRWWAWHLVWPVHEGYHYGAVSNLLGSDEQWWKRHLLVSWRLLSHALLSRRHWRRSHWGLDWLGLIRRRFGQRSWGRGKYFAFFYSASSITYAWWFAAKSPVRCVMRRVYRAIMRCVGEITRRVTTLDSGSIFDGGRVFGVHRPQQERVLKQIVCCMNMLSCSWIEKLFGHAACTCRAVVTCVLTLGRSWKSIFIWHLMTSTSSRVCYLVALLKWRFTWEPCWRLELLC